MRSPMRRSAAAESSELSPSEGSAPDLWLAAAAVGCASAKGGAAMHSAATSASGRATKNVVLIRSKGDKSNPFQGVDGRTNKLL